MYANYHTHTWRCNHACGSEREYIEGAIASGIRVLGFSDHTPNPFSWNINDGIRMLPEQTAEYFETVFKLKKEYAADIDIHAGVEVEYIPGEFHKLSEYLKDFGCEYLIMGQHYMEGIYVRNLWDDEMELQLHVSQMLEGIETGEFLYLAHPDLVVWYGSGEIYTREMTRLCLGALELDVPLEYNLLGFRNGRNYPDDRFWRIAAEVGNRVVLGIDAHSPEDMDICSVERRAREKLEKLGITNIVEVTL